MPPSLPSPQNVLVTESPDDWLVELEMEMARLYPWTCPNKVRVLISKISHKVHKDKEPVERRYLLTAISENLELLKSLLKLIEECSDSTVLANLLALFRELVAAKTPWRATALECLVHLETTEVIARLLTRVCKPHHQQPQQGISDHAFVCSFWVLSALATKDAQFSVKIRSSGAVKTIYPILKHLCTKPSSIYSVLQVVKALSRNSLTSTILGKDGIVPLVTNIVCKLANSTYGPKLKVATEALNYLTKTKQNQLQLMKQNFIADLIDIFCRHEKYADRGRVVIKIAGSLLSVFQHVVPSKSGREQFMESGGVGVLRQFCMKLDGEDKRWDRLLCRACAVLSRCCVSKPLPISAEMSPAKFNIPKGQEMNIEPESSSDSTSRETTPESDDDNEDEEDKDDDGEEDEDEEDKFAEIEPQNQVLPGGGVAVNLNAELVKKTTVTRKKEDIQATYAKFFPEFSSPTLLDNHVHNSTARGVASQRVHYLNFAQQTHGLIKFTKVAYPDMIIAGSPPSINEPLLDKNRGTYRGRIVQNMRCMLNEIEEQEQIIVYDLDKLILEDKLLGRIPFDNSHLGNDDELKISGAEKDEPDLVVSAETMIAKRRLKFESRFECGNLRKAIQIRDRQYNLILSPDVNSSKHHQWFYFQVSNMIGGEHFPYIFNIINYEKTNSQFNFGMQPVMFSVKEAMAGRPYWRRVGDDICYFRNNFSKSTVDGQNYMTASFSVTFPHDGDICYLAYHYPYTYTRLRAQLDTYLTTREGFYLKVDWLTETLGDHDVPLVTITSTSTSSQTSETTTSPLSATNIPLCDKRIVVLTARVHPGETNASWVMEGVLDFLTGPSKEAKEVRNNYIFKIIPMLNVEGVINGCHRCGLTGEDLNRRWQDPNPYLHPTIYHSKGIISYIRNILNKELFLYCDFHGHSRKKNVFLYGCSSAQSWWPRDHEFYDDPSIYQQLEEVLTSTEPCFDQKSCRYTIERGRESTARVVIWREFEVTRSYTLESSFCGCSIGKLTGYQISTHHLVDMGRNFGKALLALDHTPSDAHDQDPGLQCRTSVEKDKGMRITRLVISMPQA